MSSIVHENSVNPVDKQLHVSESASGAQWDKSKALCVLFTDTAVEHTNRSCRQLFKTQAPHLRMHYVVSEGGLTCRRTSSPRTPAPARARRQQSGRAWCFTNPLVLFSCGLAHYCDGVFLQYPTLPLEPLETSEGSNPFGQEWMREDSCSLRWSAASRELRNIVQRRPLLLRIKNAFLG